jgi:hypothetical protein
MRPRNELSIAAALLSAGAAAIHASVAVPHFDESALYGLLFVATVLFQAGWAAVVLAAPPVRLLGAGVRERRRDRRVGRVADLRAALRARAVDRRARRSARSRGDLVRARDCRVRPLAARHASGLGRRFRPCPAPLRRRWGCRRRRHHLRGDRGHGARNGRTHAWPFDAASRTRLAVKRGREPSARASCRRTPRP